MNKKSTNVNVYTGNHNIDSIDDQISFLEKILERSPFSISDKDYLCNNSLNIIIENIDSTTIKNLSNLNNKKKISILLTEHIKGKDDHIIFNGDRIEKDNFYQTSESKMNRFENLIKIIPRIKFLFRIGCLPNGDYLVNMMNKKLITIPYFTIFGSDIKFNKKKKYHFCFFGKLTPFRKKVLNILNDNFEVYFSKNLISDDKRKKILGKSMISLNIPQDKNWEWISIGRIINSYCNGVPVVCITSSKTQTFNQKKSSFICNYMPFIENDTSHFVKNLQKLLEEINISDQLNAYNNILKKHNYNKKVFIDNLCNWALTEF